MHDQYAIIPPEDQQTDSEIERRRPDANDSEISPIVSKILFGINFNIGSCVHARNLTLSMNNPLRSL